MAINLPVVNSVLNALPAGVCILKPLRRAGKITDFEYILVNEEAGKYFPVAIEGKSFLAVNGSSTLFAAMIETEESGSLGFLTQSIFIDNNPCLFIIKCIKLDEGILLFYQQSLGLTLDGDGSDGKPAIYSGEWKKLKDNIHFIGQIMNVTPDIIYILDLNTQQLIYCNRQMASELGYTKQQIAMMKNPVFDILYEEDVPQVNEHFRQMKTVTQDDKIIEIEYRLKNASGEINWFCDRNIVFKRNAPGIPVEAMGISQNITEKKLQEERIVTDLDILAQAEEIAGMGNWEYDIVSRNFKWSEGMYRLFNLPPGRKVAPEIYFDYTPEEDHSMIRDIIDSIRHDFTSFDEIITLVPVAGEKKIVRIRAVVIKDKKKKPLRMIGVDLDITSQLKATEAINELNKTLVDKNIDLEKLIHELKAFNSVASHDYKETIQILYTNLEYIVSKEARNLSDTAKANIRRAQSAIQKMKLLTEDINTYLQLYDLGINKSLIDPNSVLENVLDKMKGRIEQAGAKIESAGLPLLLADPFLLSQLLFNLIDNAIKFRKLIVALVVRIRYSRADEMNAVTAALKNTSYTIISISDNGLGFSDEDSERIFELFFRIQDGHKGKGSGIGLAVCKKIMEMHNGFITAEGMPAGGATFNCYFPSEK